MGIEDFLNDFDEQAKRRSDAKKREEEAREKQKAENEKYLADFQEYYTNIVIPQLKLIGEKLSAKFDFTYDEEPHSAQRAFFYKTQLVPKFEHFIEKIEVQIIAEGERRLITLSGNAYGKDNRSLDRDGLHRFQDVFEAFQRIDLENEITEILNKLFLNK